MGHVGAEARGGCAGDMESQKIAYGVGRCAVVLFWTVVRCLFKDARFRWIILRSGDRSEKL